MQRPRRFTHRGPTRAHIINEHNRSREGGGLRGCHHTVKYCGALVTMCSVKWRGGTCSYQELCDRRPTSQPRRLCDQQGVIKSPLMHTALVRWDRDERCLEWRVACDMRDGRAQCRTELSRETWNTTVFQGADRRTEPTLVWAECGGGTQASCGDRFWSRGDPQSTTRLAEEGPLAVTDAAARRCEEFDHGGERTQHEALHVQVDRPHHGSVAYGTYGGCSAYDTSMPTPARTIAISATPLTGVSAAEWERLLAANPTATAFSDRAVHAAWWSAHSDTAEDVSLAARDAASNELLGYLPLMKRPDGVVYSGATFHIDYATVLLAQTSSEKEDDVAAALAGALIDTNAPLNLLRLRNEDATHARMISAIKRAAQANHRTATFGIEEPAPFIDLVGISTFDEHLERLDKKERHEIRRKLRRAEVAGVQISESKDLNADLPEFIRLHRARWGEGGLFTATDKGASEERFMREIFSTAPAGMITLLLARNEEFGTFAAGLFLRDANALRYWNAGGDISARALSPGVLLFAHGLTMAISEKLPRFDFLRGNEAYKYECGAVDAQVMQLQVPA